MTVLERGRLLREKEGKNKAKLRICFQTDAINNTRNTVQKIDGFWREV